MNELLAYPLLQDGDALILERLAELHDLCSLRVDGQGRHDQVGMFLHQLAYQAGPLLYGRYSTGRFSRIS